MTSTCVTLKGLAAAAGLALASVSASGGLFDLYRVWTPPDNGILGPNPARPTNTGPARLTPPFATFYNFLPQLGVAGSVRYRILTESMLSIEWEEIDNLPETDEDELGGVTISGYTNDEEVQWVELSFPDDTTGDARAVYEFARALFPDLAEGETLPGGFAITDEGRIRNIQEAVARATRAINIQIGLRNPALDPPAFWVEQPFNIPGEYTAPGLAGSLRPGNVPLGPAYAPDPSRLDFVVTNGAGVEVPQFPNTINNDGFFEDGLPAPDLNGDGATGFDFDGSGVIDANDIVSLPGDPTVADYPLPFQGTILHSNALGEFIVDGAGFLFDISSMSEGGLISPQAPAGTGPFLPRFNIFDLDQDGIDNRFDAFDDIAYPYDDAPWILFMQSPLEDGVGLVISRVGSSPIPVGGRFGPLHVIMLPDSDGDWTVDRIVYELYRAFGFYNENQRSDADPFFINRNFLAVQADFLDEYYLFDGGANEFPVDPIVRDVFDMSIDGQSMDMSEADLGLVRDTNGALLPPHPSPLGGGFPLFPSGVLRVGTYDFGSATHLSSNDFGLGFADTFTVAPQFADDLLFEPGVFSESGVGGGIEGLRGRELTATDRLAAAAAYTAAELPFCDRLDINTDGILNFRDVLGFLDLFSAQDLRADSPLGDGNGVLDVEDLISFLVGFQTAFSDEGCTENDVNPDPESQPTLLRQNRIEGRGG